MTNFGDLGNYVNGFTCSPREICLGTTLHHILVKFPHLNHSS